MPDKQHDEMECAYRVSRAGFTLDALLSLPATGVTGVFGRSGAGKSTLLRCMAGLEEAAEARFRIGGDVVDDSARGKFTNVSDRRMAYVFQDLRLFPHLSVRRNLDYGSRRAAGNGPVVGFDDIVELLALGGLLDRMPSTLSGGEAQRVAIGRALLSAPRLLLMDEPLASLDAELKAAVLPYIERACRSVAVPVVYVSHNIDEICRLADFLVVLDAGRVIASGDPQQVLTGTDNPVIAGSEAGTVLTAIVVDYDAANDICRASVAGGDLFLPGRHEGTIRARIRANDVSVCTSAPQNTTILNVLEATVETVTAEAGASCLLRLAVGRDRLLARVTRRSADALGLEPGRAVFAQIKSVAVR